MPFMTKGRHARHGIKSARPRWLTLLLAVGLFATLMPMSAAFAEGQHSPVECDGLPTTDADVATAPDGFIIDAICIKSGDDAFDVYASPEGPKHSILITADGTYDGYVVFGIGTDEVTVDDSAAAHGLSHLDYRLVEDPPNVPQGLLSVDKTAEATFDRDHDWSILKSVDPAVVNLFTDGSGDATVTWDIDVTYEGFVDSGHEVTGTITITNDEPLFDARIDTVSDDMGDVDCDIPATLAADGGELVCDYSLTGVTEDGTNKVSVTGELIDVEDATNVYPIDEEASANFSFVLDEETDETVVVSDLSDLGDLLGGAGYTPDDLTLDADDYVADDVIPFTYSKDFAYADFGQEICGDHTYNNTATVTGDEESDFDDASVVVNVQCLIFDGETATGEGLPWKATKRAPNNWFMYTTWTDIADGGADLIAGQFHDVGDVTGSTNGTTTLTFELVGDWELADVGGNVKINPMSCTTDQNYKQPGQFARSFTVDPDDSGSFSVSGLVNTDCYGIHLDVGQWVPDPNFGV